MGMSLSIAKTMSLCIGKKPPHRVAAAEAEASAQEQQKPPLRDTEAAEQEQGQQKRTLGRAGSVLGKECKDVNNEYKLSKKIGEGTFAVTYICKEKKTGKKYACKQIAKKKIVTKSQKEDLKREVIIMEHVSGHENFVHLKGVYEDDRYVNLVMENCEGGELFGKMISKGRFSEKVAAQILCSIMKVVYCLHFMGIMHRDLKPENFLLLKKAASPCFADYTKLKAIDFGLSAYIDDEGKPHQDRVGTAFYVAPEVIKRQPYGKEADIWSAGVILYMLLTKVPPFDGENDKAIFEAIMKAKPDMESYPWPDIKDNNAKQLVKAMLSVDPSKRPTAKAVLNHQWLKNNGVAIEKPTETLIPKMRYFRSMRKFKKLALKVLMEKAPPEDFDGLRAIFKNLDTKEAKVIPREKLEKSLVRYGSHLPEEDVKLIVEAADTDGDGNIDFDEFLIAMRNFNQHKEEYHRQAFDHFDKDLDGYISKEELREALMDPKINISKEELREALMDPEIKNDDIDVIISEIDINKDGKISYEEFRAMMTS